MNCWSNWCKQKKVNHLDTGLTVLPCLITTPMNLTFKFQIKTCMSKMNAVARARSTFQMLTLLKNIYPTRASIQKHGTANVWPWYLNRLEYSALIRRLGVRVPLRSRHFLSKIFDTFARTPVRVSKMNAVARAQLTFQMLTLLQKYLYHQSQYSTTWGSRCLALIAQ